MISVAVAILTGLVLGILFYGGLWMTVRSLPTAAHPVALTVGSFWLRMVTTFCGFLLVMNGRWQNAVAFLVGFIAAKFAVSRFLDNAHHA